MVTLVVTRCIEGDVTIDQCIELTTNHHSIMEQVYCSFHFLSAKWLLSYFHKFTEYQVSHLYKDLHKYKTDNHEPTNVQTILISSAGTMFANFGIIIHWLIANQ